MACLLFSDNTVKAGPSYPLVRSTSEEDLQNLFCQFFEKVSESSTPTPSPNYYSLFSAAAPDSSSLGEEGGAVNTFNPPPTLPKEGEDGDCYVIEIHPHQPRPSDQTQNLSEKNLRHELYTECAVAYWQFHGSGINSLNYSSFMNDGPQASNALQSANQASIREYDPVMKDKSDGGANSIPTIFVTQNSEIQVEPPTSGLSEKQSYVEIEGKMESMENTDPAEAKRIRRKIINRNSARRSRKRKQDQMTDLLNEVRKLQLKNSALLKQRNAAVAEVETLITKVSQLQLQLSSLLKKYNVVVADAEILRVKMKMADDLMESVDEALQLIHRTNILELLTMFFSVSENPCNAAATPMQEDPVPPVEVHHGSTVGEEMERNSSLHLIHSKDQDLSGCLLEGLSEYESILGYIDI